MEETTFEPYAAPGKFQPPSAPEGFHMWQHKKSRILHLMEDQNNLVFTCGRNVGPFHTKEGLHPRILEMIHQFAGHVSTKLDSDPILAKDALEPRSCGRWQGHLQGVWSHVA